MRWLATIIFSASGLNLFVYAFYVNENNLTNALLLAIMGAMFLISSNTGNSHRFLFSSAFWVNVNFLFYIVLKALAVSDEIPIEPMQMALLSSLLFLLGFIFGQLLWPNHNQIELRSVPNRKKTKGLYLWLLGSFIFFKTLNIILLLMVGGESTALDFAQSTQNLGATYLFAIPRVATASYFLIILCAYKHGLYRRTAVVLTIYVFLEAIAGAARFTLVSTILIHLLLYHLYVRPVRVFYFALVAPPLVFVIALFGIVRNVEIGNAMVYAETFNTLLDQKYLIFKVFMGRMDMLPQMAGAFELVKLGQLKFEAGMSYIYAFLHAIPRNIWLNKPPLTAAYITSLVNPSAFADGVNIYPSAMLEAYMNFGWPGTILIGTLLAMLSRIYDRALRAGTLRAQALALLAFTFPMQLINEGIHSNIFGTLLYVASIFGLWLWLGRSIMGHAVANRLAYP